MLLFGHIGITLGIFFIFSYFGRVPELLINSEKRVLPPTFEENVERFLCSLFSVTRGHDPYFAPRLKNIIDPRYLAVGALLPDFIDKPLGMIVFASTISNGRMISHTLVFSLILFLIGLYLYDKKSDIKVIALASGSFFHLMEDQMWATPQTLFWPLLGWSFPKDQIVDGLAFLLMLLQESFMPQFSQGFIPEHTFIPEIIGMMIIVILALNWLKNRLSKANSKNMNLKKENT